MRNETGGTKTDYRFALLSGTGALLRGPLPLLANSGTTPGFLAGRGQQPLVWDGSGWGVLTLDGTNPLDVTFYRLDADGDRVLGPVAITATAGDWELDVDATWNGSEYGVSWIRQRDATWEVRFQRLQSNGTLLGSPQILWSAPAGSAVGHTSVIWDGANWVVAWVDNGPSPDFPQAVYLRKLNPDGTAGRCGQARQQPVRPRLPAPGPGARLRRRAGARGQARGRLPDLHDKPPEPDGHERGGAAGGGRGRRPGGDAAGAERQRQRPVDLRPRRDRRQSGPAGLPRRHGRDAGGGDGARERRGDRRGRAKPGHQRPLGPRQRRLRGQPHEPGGGLAGRRLRGGLERAHGGPALRAHVRRQRCAQRHALPALALGRHGAAHGSRVWGRASRSRGATAPTRCASRATTPPERCWAASRW